MLPWDPNPYQELLYAPMRRRGVQVDYLGQLTPSRTVNVLLLPLEVVARRPGQGDWVHLHWVFAFAFPGQRRCPVALLASHAVFWAFRQAVALTGASLAWTAHNVVPHDRVFWNHDTARRRLVAAADLVIAHSDATLAALADAGAKPGRAVVIPHGPLEPVRPVPDVAPRPRYRRHLLFFGRVSRYKGVPELLRAFAAPQFDESRLTVAGAVDDPSLTEALLAPRSNVRTITRRVDDADLATLLEDCDVVVLPFLQITTSGSAMLAMAAGRPLVIPDLPGLEDIPDDACFRYDGTDSGLRQALGEAISAPDPVLRRMGEAARTFSRSRSWEQIAEATLRAFAGSTPGPTSGPTSRPERATS